MDWLERGKTRWQSFWTSYGSKVFLALTFLLVGILCFEAGLLQKSLGQNEPVIIRTSAVSTTPLSPEVSTTPKRISPEMNATSPQSTPLDTACLFVGSKKSNKYHDPRSRCARQIKQENKRCFVSAEAAKQAGYLPGCLVP